MIAWTADDEQADADKADPGEDPRARRVMAESGLYVVYALRS
jgi:hypothetical protein